MIIKVLALCCYLHVSLAVKATLIELNDGNKIPAVALGTGRGTATPGQNVDEVRKAVIWAIEAGYRHIDTAAIYNDEQQVGEGIRHALQRGIVKREDLFITTKLWNNRHARDDVVPALKESLARLGLDYVDLYLIHSPISVKADGSFDDIDYLDTWKGMIEAKNQGLAKSIGVSNFNCSQLDRITTNSDVKPAVNQVEVNPTLTQEPLVNHCKQLGIAVMAYSPFGFLVQRYSTVDAPPPRYDDPTLVKIAEKYGKTTGQVVLRYLLDRGLIVIPKSTNKDRINQNIDLFDFKLTDDEIKTINNFNKDKRVISFGSGSPFFPFQQNGC